MKYHYAFIVACIVAFISPVSSGDLDSWNNGSSAIINVGVVNIGTTNVVGALASKQVSGSYVTALTGDVTAAGPGSVAATLAATGTAGTYRSVTTDAKGRVTAGTAPTTFSGYAISDTSANLAAALTDETGTGVAMFGTSPTITTSLTITNATTGTAPFAVNDVANIGGQRFTYAMGGNQKFGIDTNGMLTLNSGDTSSGGLLRPAIPGSATSAGGLFIGRQDAPYSLFVGYSSAYLVTLPSAGLLGWSVNGSTADFRGQDTVMSRDAAAVIQLGVDAATATAQAIKAHDGVGADKVGAKNTYEGGQSTGTAAAGAVDIATGLSAEASASTVNAYAIRYHAKAKFVALTHATATTIETFSLAANKVIGGSLNVLTYATNSVPHAQAISSDLVFQAIAIGSTITGTVDIAKAGSQAADSGTLTITGWTLVDNGDNTFSIKANVSSDLPSPTERAQVVVTALNGSAATTITDP